MASIDYLERLIREKIKLMEYYKHKKNEDAANVVLREIKFCRERLKKLNGGI